MAAGVVGGGERWLVQRGGLLESREGPGLSRVPVGAGRARWTAGAGVGALLARPGRSRRGSMQRGCSCGRGCSGHPHAPCPAWRQLSPLWG